MADTAATPWPPSIMRRGGHSRGCYFLDGLDTKGPPGGVPLAKENPAELGGQAGFRNPRLSGMGRCPRVNRNGLLIALSINHASSMRSRLQQAVIAVTRFPRHFLANDFEANRSVRAARLRAEEGGVPADMDRYFRRDAGGRGERMTGALSAAASSVHWCAISSNRSRDRKSSVTSAARRHSCAWRSYRFFRAVNIAVVLSSIEFPPDARKAPNLATPTIWRCFEFRPAPVGGRASS